jgi:competence ComEA-like helix-hairpin-helix protein
MKKIEHKWLYFALGLLLGIFLSGILFLTVFKLNKDVPFNLPQPWLSDQSEPSNSVALFSNEGKINLNTATKEELLDLPGIGPVKAMAIIDFREKYGPFSETAELLYVPGIGKKQLDQIVPYIDNNLEEGKHEP